MTHVRATDDVLETAALYVLGALPGEERDAFEHHLAEGCRTCEQEIASLTAVVGELGQAVAAKAPRPEVRERLLARLASQGTIVRAGESSWQREAFGLEVRRLYLDAIEGRVTSLVRMPPGARYPGHRHASTEELYLLSGDLTVEGERLGAGDYCAAASGTIHSETASSDGCTFLLVTSERDEVLSDRAVPGVLAAGLTFIRAVEGHWRPGVVSGVEMRRLYSDQLRGTTTALVRVAAGTGLPAHRHVTAEQLFMLSGDAHIGGETLHVGDYYQAPAGTSHDVTHSEGGCEFLLISSAVEILG